MSNVITVTGADVRAGMILWPYGESPSKKNTHKVPAYSGQCGKGRHFGSGCYDRIGRWNTYSESRQS
jgi:hypothetical protein